MTCMSFFMNETADAFLDWKITVHKTTYFSKSGQVFPAHDSLIAQGKLKEMTGRIISLFNFN